MGLCDPSFVLNWYPAPVSGCRRGCGKWFRPAGVLCRPRSGDETLSARVEDAATEPGVQGPAGLFPLPRCRRSWCISPRSTLNGIRRIATDRGRKLAQSAVGEYRVHHEAIARADPVMKCALCEDGGWVCENHPERPWGGSHACQCGGAGMPCPECNPNQTSKWW
jgi:hypothetical protein